MENAPVVNPITRPQPQNASRLTSFDSSQKSFSDHWLEPCTLVEKKDHDLDRYLFDDSCLFVSY